MNDAPASPSGFGRFLVIVLLLFAVGGFGMAALCGGVFTIASLASGSSGGGEYMGGVWVIALPSLLIGGWLCWLCARKLWRMLRAGQPASTVPPDGQ